MLLRVQSHLHYTAAQPCSVLLQIETAQDAHQVVHSSSITLTYNRLVDGQDGIGTRRCEPPPLKWSAPIVRKAED